MPTPASRASTDGPDRVRGPPSPGRARRECDDAPVSYFSYARIGPGHDRQPRPKPRRAEPGEWPKLEAALAVVNRDLMATLPGQDALVLMIDSGWNLPPGGVDRGQVYVAMPDGRWQGNAVNPWDPEEDDPLEPDDEATVLTVVAEAAQETVTELLWQVWPVCWEHKLGMHARPAGTAADWYAGATS
ncbi:hypothetical protein [Streptomyces shenzhenensis]|uniref:hypothetical protein n=1 Tax=Streptomyces shenzhenensis TaxID=943815 RepID=UPI001C68E3F9|nr:hypothetical protein [Streptomyces shenzhenensis]